MASAENTRRLIVRAVTDIAEGRVAAPGGRSLTPEAAAAQRRAQELRPELNRQPLRPGFLSQAQETAEEFFRSVGRLQPGESLTSGLSVQVRLADGRVSEVTAYRTEQVRQLRERLGHGRGGLIVNGRPLQDETPIYDLWLRGDLGGLSVAAPVIQETVRTSSG